jgi:hypothetical protein
MILIKHANLAINSRMAGRDRASGGEAMSKADEFWRFADEALRRAAQCKSEKEQQVLFNLALAWTQAALRANAPPITVSA